MRGQVVARASVAGGPLDDSGPVLAADDDRVPGPPVVGGTRQGTGWRVPDQPAPHDVGADVGQVDEVHEGGVGVAGGRMAEAGPQRGAHPLGPVGGLDDVDGQVAEQRASPRVPRHR